MASQWGACWPPQGPWSGLRKVSRCRLGSCLPPGSSGENRRCSKAFFLLPAYLLAHLKEEQKRASEKKQDGVGPDGFHVASGRSACYLSKGEQEPGSPSAPFLVWVSPGAPWCSMGSWRWGCPGGDSLTVYFMCGL